MSHFAGKTSPDYARWFTTTFEVVNPVKTVDITWCSTHEVDKPTPLVQYVGWSEPQHLDYLNHFTPLIDKVRKDKSDDSNQVRSDGSKMSDNNSAENVEERKHGKSTSSRRKTTLEEFDTDDEFYGGCSDNSTNEEVDESEKVDENFQMEEDVEVPDAGEIEASNAKEDLGDGTEEFKDLMEDPKFPLPEVPQILEFLTGFPEDKVRTDLPAGEILFTIKC